MENVHIEIFFQTSDLSLINDAITYFRSQNIEVSEWLLKSGNLKSITIMIVTTVGLNIASSWIYDKIKNQQNQETVINGNQISSQSITIEQLNQIFCSPKGESTQKEPVN